MQYPFKIFLKATFLVLLISGCHRNQNKESASYFGGQIVNPKTSKVYFLKNDKYLDSTILDNHNKFLFKFDKLVSGLYTFRHGNEYQYVYFNEGDSIILRLNTWDFDESLVFVGKGSERNNFLMNLFLDEEEEDKLFLPFYTKSPEKFNNKIDSILIIKQNLYEHFKELNPEQSIAFDKLIKVAINYPLFSKKENYPVYQKRKLKLDSLPSTETSFYDFRKAINFNDSSLVYFYPYRNYLNAFIHHKAHEKKQKLPDSNFTLNVIETITENIHQKELKNLFLYRTISDSFFSQYLNNEQREIAINQFYKHCDNEEYVSEIKQLAFDYKNIKKGTKLFDFNIVDTDGNKLKSPEIIKNKKTVLYFWSEKFINTNNLSKRILYLQETYPNLNFIGINIDTDKGTWLKSNIFTDLSTKNQFHLAKNCVMRNFITTTTPRIILLNKNAIIENGFTVLWAHNFDKELNFLNKN